MGRTIDTEWTCMCMIRDGSRVVTLDKVGEWSGITFPGGHIEQGESFAEAVRREVLEETGLVIRNAVPCGVVHWSHREKAQKYIVLLYRAEGFEGELITEMDEGQLSFMELDEMKGANLAPNMLVYLDAFSREGYTEVYAEYGGGEDRPFRVFTSKVE